MPTEHVASVDDPRLAWYRGVADPILLREGGRFVAEGRAVVARLLVSRWDVESVLVSPAAHAALATVLESRPAVPIFVAPLDVLTSVAGYNIHRGCLAIAWRKPPLSPADVMRSAAGQRIWLALEQLADPDNVGSCFRNAAAFGVGAVLLDERCADPLYRKAIRTSMAATLLVPFARAVGWDDALNECRVARRVVVGLTPSSDAQDLAAFARDRAATQPVLLLAGSEDRGLDAGTMRRCDRLVRIPIAREVDSLNVATAVGIALHALSAADERG